MLRNPQRLFFPDGESILYHAIYANNLRLVQLLLFLHPRLLHEKDRLGNTAEVQFALHAPSRRSKILMFLAAYYSAHPPRNPYQGTTAHKHFFNNYADQLGLPELLPITLPSSSTDPAIGDDLLDARPDRHLSLSSPTCLMRLLLDQTCPRPATRSTGSQATTEILIL